MGVDEPGRHNGAGRRNYARRLPLTHLPDPYDPVPMHGNVGLQPGPAGPVDYRSSNDGEVENGNPPSNELHP
jgi:hypothetical protein